MGHSPSGYLSAVKITQVVASCCLLPWGKHGSAGRCLCSAFPRSWAHCGPGKVPGANAAQQWLTLSAPVSPPCQNSSSGGFPVLHTIPCSLSPSPAPRAPWICFPLLHSSMESMVVAEPSSERCSTQNQTSRQICNTPFKTCFVLMPKGRNCIELATVQM